MNNTAHPFSLFRGLVALGLLLGCLSTTHARVTEGSLKVARTKIQTALGETPPNTTVAKTLLLPLLEPSSLKHKSTYSIVELTQTVASVLKNPEDKIELLSKAITVADSIYKNKEAKSPFRLRALASMARLNYELGALYQNLSRSIQNPALKKQSDQALAHSNKYLDQAVALFKEVNVLSADADI